MRTLVVLMLLLGLSASAATAQVPTGTVLSADPVLSGTWTVRFPSVDAIQIRDVFDVSRAGKVIGQAMVMATNAPASTASLVQLASFQGTIRPGDTATFVRHDAMPVTPQPGPPTGPNAPSVIGDIPPPEPRFMTNPPFNPYDLNQFDPGHYYAPEWSGVPSWYPYEPWYHDYNWSAPVHTDNTFHVPTPFVYGRR